LNIKTHINHSSLSSMSIKNYILIGNSPVLDPRDLNLIAVIKSESPLENTKLNSETYLGGFSI
jgi:hypothetical protein